MSIFWLGGPEGIILPFEQMNTTEEDRYFLPGVIHGSEDYLLQVYAWNNNGEPKDERIAVKYLFAQDIVNWAKAATMDDGTFVAEVFEMHINDAEEFVVENDGTGDFVTLNEKWNEAKPWDYAQVISWAKQQIEKELAKDTIKESAPASEKSFLADKISDAVARFQGNTECANPSGLFNVVLSQNELELIVKSLDAFGDRVADREGYSSGEKYWDLKDKLVLEMHKEPYKEGGER